jgi:hypothetical protein
MEIYPDYVYQKKLLDTEIHFWNEYILQRVPPPEADKDFKNLAGVTKWANQWKAAQEKIVPLLELMKEAETYMKEAAEKAAHPRLMANGIRMTQVPKQGAVDYGLIPELESIDLDQYRKPGSVYWKMDMPKPKKEKATNGKTAAETAKKGAGNKKPQSGRR